MNGYDPTAASGLNIYDILRTPNSDRKRKEPTNATIPYGKRRKTNDGALNQIISYTAHSTSLYGDALYDHIIKSATLLPADVVLKPTSYWFVSPIELEIQRSPLIQIHEVVQYKEYHLYYIISFSNGQAEFCDTSGNLLAHVEWQFHSVETKSQSHPLNSFFNSYQRVQEAFGGTGGGSTSAVRQDMWNRFTQTDDYKRLAPDNSGGNNNRTRDNGTPPSFDEVPDAYKTFLHNDYKPPKKPQPTTVPYQSGFNNAPASYESDLFPSYVSDGVLFTTSEEQNQDNRDGRIPFSQIKLGEVIGEGSYGVIYYAEFNKQKHAIKRFKYYEAKKEDALKEAEVLMKLRHKRIVSLVGITTDPKTDEIMLVMEYMDNGSLEDLLVRDKAQLTREDVIQIGLDIAKGLHYLHAQKIIHRDLKSANVLLYDNKKRAKLSDFGTVRIFGKSSKATTIIGTMGFMAPEILCENPYGAKADVYSFGALLHHMLTLKMLPVMFQDSAQASTKIKEQVKDVQLQELIIKCCKREPEERPSIDECIASLVKMQYELKP